MPGQRAPGVRPRAIPIHDDLWTAALAKARREGRSLSEVIREALRRYVGDGE